MKSLSQIIGETKFTPPSNIRGLQRAATIASHDTEHIDIPSPQAEGLSSISQSIAATQNESPVTGPHSTAMKIPRLRKTTYVFPDASSRIRQAHKDRYPVLKDIFQRNIENSPKLCDYTTHISYELRMCGPCEADATESILIFCPSGLLKKIKTLLTQPHIRSQFEPEIETSTFVRFELFFWASTIEMLALHDIAVVIPEEPDSDDSIAAVVKHMPWGLQILERDHGEQHIATIGCIVQVGHDQFGLTTAHAFDHPLAIVPEDQETEGSDSDKDDEEYDLSMGQEDHDASSMEMRLGSVNNDRGRTVQLGECQVHTVPPLEETSAWMRRHPNLDWALVELGLNKNRLPNSAAPINALPIVEHLPQDCTDVLIITLPYPGVPGTLYSIPSYIGAVKGSQAAEVWTVGSLPKETREFQYAKVSPRLRGTTPTKADTQSNSLTKGRFWVNSRRCSVW